MPKEHNQTVLTALGGMTHAYNELRRAMAMLGPEDIGVAFEAYGIEGMQPVSSKFMGFNAQGKAMYSCKWWDNTLEGPDRSVLGTAFVWYDVARNKLLADT